MRGLFPFFCMLWPLMAGAEPGLIGRWRFTSMIYRGQEQAPLNPALVLEITFQEGGLNRLHYYRKGENGFCDRMASYRVEEETGVLIQKVLWVHPGNRFDCAADPDMRMGSETRTPVALRGGRLEMTLGLGEESLVYVWTPVEP